MEQVQFAAYKQFCTDTTREKKRAIKEANAKIEGLNAGIQKAEADAATLAKHIQKIDKDISTWEGDKKAATQVREIEKKDYAKAKADTDESIEAVDEGIKELKAQAHDVSQDSLAQITKKIP